MIRPKNWSIKIASQTHQVFYRLLRGRVVGRLGRAQFLLLTTTGRKSGRPRTVPLLYLVDNGCYTLVGSYGGNPTDPAWLLNIRSNPQVSISLGNRGFSGTARIAAETERQRLWPEFISVFPNYNLYQSRTARCIPIIIVEPQS